MKRIKSLDCYKGILIILVCIRHILQHNVSDEGGILTNFIWAIQMPGFILVSGYFSQKEIYTIKDIGRNIYNKVRSYGLPFITWYFLINILLLGKNDRNIYKALKEIIYHVDSGLWFLWVIMILGIFASIINYCLTIKRKNKSLINRYGYAIGAGILLYGGAIIIGKIMGLQFLGIQYILYYSIYYWLGFLIKINHNMIVGFYYRNKSIIGFICTIIYLTIVFNFDLYRCNDNILSIIFRILSALTGNLLLYDLCVNNVEKLEKYKIDYIGLFTLEIYAVHINVINMMENNNTVGNAFTLYSLNGFENFVIASLFMVLYTALIIIFFKSNCFTNFLMFGKARKK